LSQESTLILLLSLTYLPQSYNKTQHTHIYI